MTPEVLMRVVREVTVVRVRRMSRWVAVAAAATCVLVAMTGSTAVAGQAVAPVAVVDVVPSDPVTDGQRAGAEALLRAAAQLAAGDGLAAEQLRAAAARLPAGQEAIARELTAAADRVAAQHAAVADQLRTAARQLDPAVGGLPVGGSSAESPGGPAVPVPTGVPAPTAVPSAPGGPADLPGAPAAPTVAPTGVPTAPQTGVPAAPTVPGAPAIPTATPGGPATPDGPAAGEATEPDSSECTETAAEKLGWGAPTRRSDFQDGLPGDWHPYGPEPGHAKRGIRTPDAITVQDGNATITSTQDGTTGAMSWHPGQKYGRWEACVRADAGKGGINALLLLWPVAEDFPVGGEIDWMEILDASRQKTSFFLHYGAGNNQEYGSVQHDSTQWSAYALEWTPEQITAYVDGEVWYTSRETARFPPRPMNMTMQLDYFGGAGGGTAMQMDWAAQWALPESEPATLSLAPGDPATGQPRDFPERAPRDLGARSSGG